MFAKPEQVGPRRLRRRLKAAASIAVALAAGVFLACHRGVEEVKDAIKATRDAPDAEDVGLDADADAGADVASGPMSDSIAIYVPASTDAAVDTREHKKGMPVPDNLLE